MREITVESLSSPGCHNCKVFEEFWHTIESKYQNVKYRNVDVTTSEGMEMAGKYSIFASPGIIINNTLFSTGGVDKDEFVKKLDELSA